MDQSWRQSRSRGQWLLVMATAKNVRLSNALRRCPRAVPVNAPLMNDI
jgi:hypothetical protein